MKRTTCLILLLCLSLAACAGLGKPAPTASPTVRPPTPTQTRTATPTPEPSPTALLLPTSSSPEEPTRVPGASPTPPLNLLDQYLPGHQVVAETEHFTFHSQNGYFPVDKAWFITQAEALYSYVSQRLQGAKTTQKINVAFMRPETRACPVRGLASQDDPPTILIYADEKSTQTYLLAVLSHELGHAIPAEGFPGGLPDSLALTEGLATYASGKYWDAWQGVASLDDLIRRYLQTGQYEPIYTNHDLHGIYPWQKDTGSSQACLERRDRIYSEWAGFLGYLIQTYGWEKAQRLFVNPPPEHKNGQLIEFPPDYEGIYGKSLNQLEWEWLQKINRP